jgi:branched-subunit amino acid aminotransferase/4-amino-4-deoxychorismate lyase
VSGIAIVNGKLVDPAAPAVSVFDAAVLHGDAYFETLRTYNGRPALLAQHLARLGASIDVAGFPDPPPAQVLEDEVAAAINEFSEGELAVRLMVSRGVREAGLSEEPETTTRIVTARLLGSTPAGTDATATVIDVPGYSFPHKSANYQPQAALARRARAAGFDEAIIADSGELIEGATSNVFVLKDGELSTPALGRCLPGVTRAAVLALAAEQGLHTIQRAVGVEEFASADEVFISNSLIELRRIERLDGEQIGGRATSDVSSLRDALLAVYESGFA